MILGLIHRRGPPATRRAVVRTDRRLLPGLRTSSELRVARNNHLHSLPPSTLKRHAAWATPRAPVATCVLHARRPGASRQVLPGTHDWQSGEHNRIPLHDTSTFHTPSSGNEIHSSAVRSLGRIKDTNRSRNFNPKLKNQRWQQNVKIRRLDTAARRWVGINSAARKTSPRIPAARSEMRGSGDFAGWIRFFH